MEKLKVAARDGQPIRVWKSGAAFSACGFAFLCNTLWDIDCPLRVISLPECWTDATGAVYAGGDWGEVPPGQYYRYLPLEREVPAMEKQLQSDIWRRLRQENAPLRAVVNGRLVSVSEDFYDAFLIRQIPEGEFLMARLIGTVLGAYSFGIGDGWLTLRIQKLVSDGKLKLVRVSDPTHPYGKVYQRTDKPLE